MTEETAVYHRIKHDNELPDKIFTIEGVNYFQFRIHPPRDECPTIHSAVFDVKLHADGRVEIANLLNYYKMILVPL